MIGTSIWDYIFIRACIFVLHWIAPLSIFWCLVSLLYPPFHLHWIFQAWATIETAFYLLVYHPRRIYLQRAATHPTPISRERRRALFCRCHQNIPDPERYLRKWFRDAPTSEIKRENVKDFFRWAFLNNGVPNIIEDEELEEYIRDLEELLNRRIEPGRGSAKCFRLTLDEVDMLHRSLTWYLVSSCRKTRLNSSIHTTIPLIFGCPTVCICRRYVSVWLHALALLRIPPDFSRSIPLGLPFPSLYPSQSPSLPRKNAFLLAPSAHFQEETPCVVYPRYRHRTLSIYKLFGRIEPGR